MRSRWLAVPAALAAAAIAVFACKSSPTAVDPCGKGAPPDLSGSYTFLSYKVGTQTWTAPSSSGSLKLTDTNYVRNITVPFAGLDTNIVDTGRYYITGASCITEFSELDTSYFSGTFKLVTTQVQTTYTETGTNGTQPVAWSWAKIP